MKSIPLSKFYAMPTNVIKSFSKLSLCGSLWGSLGLSGSLWLCLGLSWSLKAQLMFAKKAQKSGSISKEGHKDWNITDTGLLAKLADSCNKH